MEEVILVDESGNEIGQAEKMSVHGEDALLHSAISVFIVSSRQETLLQLRSVKKHHFGGLWTNTCCSHPQPGETIDQAAHRRLQFEMGFDTELRFVFDFIYKASDPKSGLTEHEFDHVLVGTFDGMPQPNTDEADDYRWIGFKSLDEELRNQPDQFTPWFKLAWPRLEAELARLDSKPPA